MSKSNKQFGGGDTSPDERIALAKRDAAERQRAFPWQRRFESSADAELYLIANHFKKSGSCWVHSRKNAEAWVYQVRDQATPYSVWEKFTLVAYESIPRKSIAS